MKEPRIKHIGTRDLVGKANKIGGYVWGIGEKKNEEVMSGGE
jgi:hypothetical protein